MSVLHAGRLCEHLYRRYIVFFITKTDALTAVPGDSPKSIGKKAVCILQKKRILIGYKADVTLKMYLFTQTTRTPS